ncbi:MAG: hypothetical protein ABIN25_09995, partial [Ginsengibacter sp.]
MLKKFFLLLRTIKYLTAKQIFYQIFYRLAPTKSLAYYEKETTNFSPLTFTISIASSEIYKENNTFIFLNQEKRF